MLAVVVHGGHISDSRGCRLLLIRLFSLFPDIVKIWVDGGYKRGCIEWAHAMFGYVLEVVERLLTTGFAIVKKRWIVERTFAWLTFSRRLSKDYEHNPKSSEAHIKIIMIRLMVKRLAGNVF